MSENADMSENTSDALKSALLEQIIESKKVIQKLSDEELEEVTGGSVTAWVIKHQNIIDGLGMGAMAGQIFHGFSHPEASPASSPSSPPTTH